MCLVNEEDPNEEVSLPGLKTLLSKGSSAIAKYFLGSISDLSLSNFLSNNEGQQNCKVLLNE